MASCHRCGESTNNAHGFCRNCVGAALKEEVMETETQSTCPRCDTWMHRSEGPLCIDCRLYDAAILREVYDRTFYAALGGNSAINDMPEDWCVRYADQAALEAVRTHAARMAELERVIAEGSEG